MPIVQIAFIFQITIAAGEVNKGYTQEANGLIEQEAIADSGGRWIKGSHVHH